MTTPTEYVGKQVRRLRTARGWTQPQLAERCRAAGLNWDRSIIANVEAGRRQSVAIHEVIALADVFHVAPILMLFPVGVEETIEYLPGKTFDTWSAVKLFSGEAYEAGRENTHWAVPLYLFRQHEQALEDYLYNVIEQQLSLGNPDDTPKRRQQQAANALRRVKTVRAEIRRHGLTPPRLDDDLKHIDDQPHRFVPFEDMAAARAEGWRPVNHRDDQGDATDGEQA